MRVRDINLRQSPKGQAIISILIDAPPSEYSEVASKIKEGKAYDFKLSPITKAKSLDQLGAIWSKINLIADALFTSKDEIYEEVLRRYGQGVAMRVTEEGLGEISNLFRIIDIKERREDGTAFVVGYKGLSQMTSAEASVLLEGILSECKEMGLSAEVEHA